MLTFREVERIIFQCGLETELAVPPKHSPFGEIRWANGAEYHARGAQHGGKFLRGWSGHILDIDEAGLIPDATLNEAILPMGTDYDGQINKMGTPWGRNHLFKSFEDGGGIEGKPAQPGCFALRCSTYDNPFVSRRYIERVLIKNMTKLQIDTEILALFSDDIGKVFKWDSIQAAYNLETEVGSDPKPDRIYVMGWDLAKSIDWTVGVVLDITDEHDLKLVYKERFQRTSWDYVVSRIVEVGRRYGTALAAVDATGLGDPIVERLTSEISVEPFKFSAESKPALVNNLKILMEEGRIKFDYWGDFVDELRYYSFQLSSRSKNILMGTQSEHDDCVIAFALAAWAFTNCYTESKISLVGH